MLIMVNTKPSFWFSKALYDAFATFQNLLMIAEFVDKEKKLNKDQKKTEETCQRPCSKSN